MASAKGKVVRWFGRLVLQEATVASLSPLGSDFLLVRLDWAGKVDPGDKIQVLLPSDDVRTFTPIRLPDGAVAVLGHLRPDGPASGWLRALRVGDPFRFVGPGRSLRLAAGPVVMVGDETSLAVAGSYRAARPGAIRAVFELGPDVDATAALAALDLADARVLRRGQDSAETLVDAVLAGGAPAVAITGSGELVQRARAALRPRGVRPTVKAYWIEGRAGLD